MHLRRKNKEIYMNKFNIIVWVLAIALPFSAFCETSNKALNDRVEVCKNNAFKAESRKICIEAAKDQKIDFEILKYCNGNTFGHETLSLCLEAAKNPKIIFEKIKFCNENTFSDKTKKTCYEIGGDPAISLTELRHCNQTTAHAQSFEACVTNLKNSASTLNNVNNTTKNIQKYIPKEVEPTMQDKSTTSNK